MKAISYFFVLVCSLLFCTSCCKGNDPKSSEQRLKNYVESELLELRGSKVFYWYKDKRIVLNLQSEDKQYVLCTAPDELSNLPEGWRLHPASDKRNLYDGAFYGLGAQKLVYGLLSKDDVLPKGFTEIYRGDSYVGERSDEPIIMTEQIVVELSDSGTFRDLAELADLLDLIIVNQNHLSPKQFTLSARRSPYPVWQAAHILHKHASILFATPDFLVKITPLNR